MPTPILPLLHALLDALSIPIHPQTLSSTSPSLLLLVLETINGEKLPLPRSLRSDSTQDAESEGQVAKEVEIVKCLLGTLDEQLSKDLTVVDPRRVVDGRQEELGVVIMALAVLARRRGIHVRVPSPTYDGLEDEWEEEDSLAKPLEPDISLSPRLDGDVFGRRLNGATLFDRDDRPILESVGQQSLDMMDPSPTGPQYKATIAPDPLAASLDGVRDDAEGKSHRPLEIDAWLDEPGQDPFPDARVYRHLSSPSHNASSSTVYRTVLDDIIEEFGLAPDP